VGGVPGRSLGPEAERALGAPLPAGSGALLFRLLDRLAAENEVQNLTAIEDPGDMVVDHLLDSLALGGAAAAAGAPFAAGDLCVDVGTGAGFPGIPLAATLPGTRWILVESEGRKVQWLERIVADLGLRDVEVFRGRARELRHARKDLEGTAAKVTARAVGDLGKLCREARGLLRPGGLLFCPKGRNLEPAEVALGDREARKSGLEPAGTVPLEVPERSRVCVVYRRGNDRTRPDRFGGQAGP
jgi:16S rRNA (guanine527-N7)-methyltransferase